MMVGGYALPYYGAIRTTLDIDLAVVVRTEEEFGAFSSATEAAGFMHAVGSFDDHLSMFRASDSGLEVEFWTKLDGVTWDEETLARRTRQQMGGLSIWVISPEDLIVTKLARPDRGVQDEKDVKSVLERLRSSMDREYLLRRAREAGVEALLDVIEGTP
jgi:predicted nucleotidyltransferase